MKINPVKKLKGSLEVPGDKSISHRGIILGSIAKGDTKIKGFLMSKDCISTINCFLQMGISISIDKNVVNISGKGIHGLKKPEDILDVGNSGTTIRLLSGLLSGQTFSSTITGDSSIVKRPMDRILDPLIKMNAKIKSLNNNNLAPLIINPSNLKNINYNSPIASAQIKSSIILASIYANSDNITTIKEPSISRNHSELMLNYFGANIQSEGKTVICNPIKELYARELIVPSDISSAAYFMVSGLITKDSEITLKNVCINSTRDGIIHVLKAMNAQIEVDNIRFISGEKVADITVKTSKLNGTIVEGEIIPTLIDEIPIIAVAAVFAEGKTLIKDAAELKVKESNRIDAMVNELKKMGASIEATEDGMIINGTGSLNGAIVDSYNDHRIAMSLSIAALKATSDTTILKSECIDISYPNFFNDLKDLID